MNIKQTASHLQLKNQPFDVNIVKGGVEKSLYTNLEPTDVEGLLNEVIEAHAPEQLIIQERKRNGSSNTKQDKFPVALGALPELLPQRTPVMQTENIFPSDFKDYLIKDLEKKNDKLEKQVDKLEADNEKLKKENFELEKENKYKDKEFELTQKASEMERTNGLAGIVETVGNNPMLANVLGMAMGRLMGVDMAQISGGNAETVQEPSEAANETAGKVGSFIKNWVSKLDEATATNVFKIVHAFNQNPEKINEVLMYLQNNEDE